MLYITIRHGDHYYRGIVTPRWAAEHDNGALISCGLNVPEELSGRCLAGLLRRGQAKEIPFDEWSHSGCQSSCIRRGDTTCSW